MNTNLITTIALRQHLDRAYDEVGEDLWPILGGIVRDLMETRRVPSDQDRFEYEIREW